MPDELRQTGKRIVSVAVAITYILFVATARAQDTKGLVGCWTFDQAKGGLAADSSGAGNNGRIHGAEFMKRGSSYALKFDGVDDYVDCGDARSLRVHQAVTVMAWVFSDGAQSGEVGLVLKKSWSQYGLTAYQGRCYWYISGGQNNCSAQLPPGVWHHVAGTYDGGTMRLYVGGKLVSWKTLSVPIMSSGNLYIGRATYANSYFRGAIDDVRIYNRALSAEEIKAHSEQSFKDTTPPGGATYAVRLRVTSDLPFTNVPMYPLINFSAVIARAGLQGVLDPNSIHVVNTATGRAIPHVIEDCSARDTARVEWVIENRAHKEYDIRFKTAEERTRLHRGRYVPLMGVGDLLRYNAGKGGPLAPTGNLSGLADVNGDGKRDLVGIWTHAHRPGEPWNPMVFWPRVGSAHEFKFGDMIRLRRLPNKYYSRAHVADVNEDGLPDVAYMKAFSGDGKCDIYLFRNTGERDDFTGLCEFIHAGKLPQQPIEWHSIRIHDLDNDGALDVILTDDAWHAPSVSTYFLANTNPRNWPISLAAPRLLNIKGYKAAFFDVDRDGLLDAVSLIEKAKPRGLSDYRLGWQKNLGRDTPTFGPVRDLPEINKRIPRPRDLLAVNEGEPRGLLVVYDDKQRTAFFVRKPGKKGRLRFQLFGQATCDSAVVSASDQAWPCVCDWDGDGDWDLLVGGGYGWPRILINCGTNEKPALSEPQLIYAQGKPIRILREEVLGKRGSGHNMGYPYPVYVDWDGDGLPDLMLPNETNRILWYKNIGTRSRPGFGKQRQVICDGFPDSPERRARSAELATGPKGCYPAEPDRPFPWRTGAGFGDWNGDGLMDMVTTSGVSPRAATLFVQYRDAEGNLRLKRDRVLKTTDGGTFHETRYVCVDWDRDGDLDIVCSGPSAKVRDTVYLARNVGTNKDPVFEYGPLRFFGEMIYITRHGPCVDAADLDGDGLPDILACVEWSVYPFYSHAAIEMKARPTYRLGTLKQLMTADD